MLNPVDDSFLAVLRDKLPAATFRDTAPHYLEEPRGRYHGIAGQILAPACTEDVSVILRACHEAIIPVIPYGGGTGLVGGQLAHDLPAPVILSLERMTQIRAMDAAGGTMVAEAGVILQKVQEAAAEENMLFPMSLASEGTARIGGCLATNAGGVNVIRYGNTRDLCLGIEAVLPTGQIIRGLSGLRKDNIGYDLRHLLIGSEGSLGVITAASLKLAPMPTDRATGLFVVDNPEAALGLLGLARQIVGDSLSAFELIARAGLEFLEEVGPKQRLPFKELPNWLCLVDLGVSGEAKAEEALLTLFEAALEAGLCEDGAISQSETQRTAFWAIRENIPQGNRRIGSIASHDISIPVARIPEFIEEGRAAIAALGPFRINSFGHLGDGNLHYNVFPPKGGSRDEYNTLRSKITQTVHDLTHAYGGSVSAEHGVGRLKVEDQDRYGDPGLLFGMRAIKSALDPHGIMNPGAVLVAN